jgi:hypothetical protein
MYAGDDMISPALLQRNPLVRAVVKTVYIVKKHEFFSGKMGGCCTKCHANSYSTVAVATRVATTSSLATAVCLSGQLFSVATKVVDEQNFAMMADRDDSRPAL